MRDDELEKRFAEINSKLDTILQYVVPFEVQIRKQQETLRLLDVMKYSTTGRVKHDGVQE